MSQCVNREMFEKSVQELKKNAKTKDSLVNVCIDEEFFYRARKILAKEAVEATKWEVSTIKRKGWTLRNDIIVSKESKEVVPFGKLYEVLCIAHIRVAHRGRDKTINWVKDNYSEINQTVINVFVNLCKVHAEQKSITDRVKVVSNPIISKSFLEIIEMDLMDFNSTPCNCSTKHKWAINIIDHHTKFIYVQPMKAKRAEEVLECFEIYCYTYGFPKKLITDNGLEFKNKLLKDFCIKNQIELCHGSPRTPTTQGLVERANRTWKETIRATLLTDESESSNWCKYTSKAAYIINITTHRAIKQTPYEAVFGFKAHRECATMECEEETPTRSSRTEKRIRDQTDYNNKMISQTQKKAKKSFQPGDIVSIKIDKVDKVSTIHPRMIIGKIIDVADEYAKVATKYGIVKGQIHFTRLTPSAATNIEFNENAEIAFSAACKKCSP